MNMEDEIRRQKERLRAEQKQQERDEVFKRELWAHGFGPLSPLLVCPFDKLKTIVDEAKPNMLFPTPMVIWTLPDGRTLCRERRWNDPAGQTYTYAFSLSLSPSISHPFGNGYRNYKIYIFQNGLATAASERYDEDYGSFLTDASSILTQNPYDGVNWDEGENLERFRKAIIEGIAKETLRLEQEKAKALEQEKTEAAAAKKSGCYVATAVYGSYDCPQVWTLRRFRDNELARSALGRAFIRAYYAVSPTLIRWFGGSRWFRRLWRGPLDRLAARLRCRGVEDTPYQDQAW